MVEALDIERSVVVQPDQNLERQLSRERVPNAGDGEAGLPWSDILELTLYDETDEHGRTRDRN